MLLRNYHPNDLERLYEIDQICFEPGIAFSKRQLKGFLSTRSSFTIVAEDDHKGKIAGFILAHTIQAKIGYLVTIDVLPQYRRQGIGSRLLNATADRFRKQGVEWIYLETAIDNSAAIRVYQKHGYQIMDRIPGYYRGRIDAYVMACRL